MVRGKRTRVVRRVYTVRGKRTRVVGRVRSKNQGHQIAHERTTTRCCVGSARDRAVAHGHVFEHGIEPPDVVAEVVGGDGGGRAAANDGEVRRRGVEQRNACTDDTHAQETPRPRTQDTTPTHNSIELANL